MSSRSKVDEPLRRKVVTLKTQGMTISAIAKEISRSKSVISRILKLYDDTGSFKSPKTSGRPRKTTHQQNQTIQKLSMVDRFDTAAGIARQVTEEFGMKVSRQTVSRRLWEAGLHARSSVVQNSHEVHQQEEQKCRYGYWLEKKSLYHI